MSHLSPAIPHGPSSGENNPGDDDTGTKTSSSSAVRVRLLEREVQRLRLLVPKQTQRSPKLVILDLNGLLLYRRLANKKDALPPPPRPFDKRTGSFCVWLRPHATSFLDFLLSRFHVAIWSSAQMHNIVPLLNLLGLDPADPKLAFVWSQAQCTDTGTSHPENEHRPLFLKETSKIFDDPSHAGLFSAENTLLIDDDAYKAERNLADTCISPHSYHGETEEEDCNPDGQHLGGLGPTAELRRWLGRLALAESVSSYVARAPWPPVQVSSPGTASRELVQSIDADSTKGGRSSNRRGSHRRKDGHTHERKDNNRAAKGSPRPANKMGGDARKGQGRHSSKNKRANEVAALASDLQEQNTEQFAASTTLVHRPHRHAKAPAKTASTSPAPEPASSTSAGASTSAVSITAEERLEVTNALRVAVLQGDVEGLKLAVSVAERLGLHGEASMGHQKLTQLLNNQ